MFGQNLKKIRQSKGLSINELSRRSGVNASYISAIERDEKKNPSMEILEKLAIVLNSSVSELTQTNKPDILISDDNGNTVIIEAMFNNKSEFKTAADAMQFILKQPAIMGYGGFDIEKLTEQEIIDFANDLLNQLQLVSLKYKK